MSRLKVFLLGSPRIERDSVPVKVDTRKAIALLAYVAVTGERHTRDALATLLWPEYDQTRARAVLRRTLSALNKALGGQCLDVDRESLGLNRDAGFWLDVDQFHSRLAECQAHGHSEAYSCPACLTPLTEAIALYRDDFLAGFTLRDSPSFDDWQFFQAENLRRELAGALENLVHYHSAQGEFEPAITHARRWLALDPLHEPAHRRLMQLYAWSGQHAAALRQYRDCVRILEEELGVPPLEETTQLYESIKEQRSRGVEEQGRIHLRPSAPLPLRTPAPLLPLVGRSRELAALLRAYDAISADGHFVVLEGEAGIGKTRLAEAFLAHVRAKGAVTIAARCYEGETNLAYGPFVEGLSAALGQPGRASWLEDVPTHWLSEAARLLPELADFGPKLPSLPPLDSPGAQSRFFEGVNQVLLTLCDGAMPGVLFFDDLHWADEASVDLLTYMVRRIRGRPLCILVTWRGERVSAGHRLYHMVAEAQRSGIATLLSLSRLSRSDVTELVRSVTATGMDLPAGLGERLYHETEGLPFFLVEYLTALTKGEDAGESDAWSMPGRVRDLLRSRLAAISETGWQLLNTAAVIGRSFDFDALRSASGRSEEESVTALEELIVQGLVEEMRDSVDASEPSYDFSHEKLRALVYEETSLARRRLLHRRVAEALAGRARGRREIGSVASQIAHHYRMAGHDAEAAEFFKLAGEYARALFANREALTHFHSALALGHPWASALHEAVGDLQTLLGEYSAALTSYETAAALHDPIDLANVEHKLGRVYHRLGEWELAESHFQAALAEPGEKQNSGQRGRVCADWSLTAHHRGQADRALNLAHQALELADAAGDTRARAQAHNILGVLARSQGDLSQARHHLEHSLSIADTLDDPGARVAALNNLALVFADRGDIERALELTETALALCASQGDRHREAALHNNLADLLHTAGQSEAAMSNLKQAVTIFAEIGEEAGTLQPEIWKLVEW